jgi:hypothetical protein
MDLQQLKTRLNMIEMEIKRQDGVVAQQMTNLNMLNGGRQELLHWIGTLEAHDLKIQSSESEKQ